MTKDKTAIPTHVGLVLDGNRRWAREQGLTVAQGHRQGYQNLKTVAKAAIKHGVRYVSAYVFSSENWQRDRQEVRDIMNILRWVLKHEAKEFHKENIRLRVIGSKAKLGAALLTAHSRRRKNDRKQHERYYPSLPRLQRPTRNYRRRQNNRCFWRRGRKY